jgi:hypothetical protein
MVGGMASGLSEQILKFDRDSIETLIGLTGSKRLYEKKRRTQME